MKICTKCEKEFTKPEMEDMCRGWHERCDECYREGLLNDFRHIIDVLESAKEMQDKETQ